MLIVVLIGQAGVPIEQKKGGRKEEEKLELQWEACGTIETRVLSLSLPAFWERQ
jgi:hypothetical protein